MKIPAQITDYEGKDPHPDNGGWHNFLKTCEVRDEYDGVIFFGTTNCNYIVFPDGFMIRNYGYHGKALMNKIRDVGKEAVIKEVVGFQNEFDSVMADIRRSVESL